MSDIYDRMGKKGGGDLPEFFKFHSPGTKFSGTVTNVRTHDFDRIGEPGEKDTVIILDCLEDGSGQPWSIKCGSTGLHNAVVEKRPTNGDHITVERGPNAGQAHTWVVTVDQNEAPPAPAPAAPAPEPSTPMA